MRWCCPPRLGCNRQGDDEPCALQLCRTAADESPDAALAVLRWEELQRACENRRNDGERRFRRRAYERARDRALMALALQAGSGAEAPEPSGSHQSSPRHRGAGTPRRIATA